MTENRADVAGVYLGLAVERPPDLAGVVRARLDVSLPRFWQVVNRLIDDPVVAGRWPREVGALRAVRARSSASRATRW